MLRRLFRRRTLAGALLLLLLAVTAGAWGFARTEKAARLVAAKLEARLGAPVRVGSLAVGPASSTVLGLQIFEKDADPDHDTPILIVGTAEVGQSPLFTVLGFDPGAITLRDARVTLRFNKAGDLITRLPEPEISGGGAVPNVRMVASELTFLQEGHPEAKFHGIDLSIATEAGNPVARGTLADARWGNAEFEGLVDLAGRVATFSLRSPQPREITPELLEQTPFVNPNAWKAVRLSGSSGLNLDLRVDLVTEKLTYRLTMLPTRTSIDIPSVGLSFREATGELVAEATGLRLNHVRGKVADGVAQIDAVMEFGDPARDVLSFNAEITHADVTRFPANWRIPGDVEGRLSGRVNFEITIPTAGGVKTDGRGEGIVENVKIRGLSADPIRLMLRPSVSGGFQFFRKSDTAGDLVALTKPDKTPLADPAVKKDPVAKKNPPAKGGVLSFLLKGIARIIKPVDAPKDERAYLHINISLSDVNAADVLKSLKFALPAKVEGKVTVRLQADIPTEAPDDFSAYRLTGTLSSPKLTIEDLSIEQATMKLVLAKGVLTVQELRAKLPGQDADSPAGMISGGGELSLEKPFRFKASVKLNQVALERLDDVRDLIPVGIQLSGSASAEAKAEGTLSPLALKGSGSGRLTGLKVGPIPIGEVTTRWDADEKAIQFSEIRAGLFKGELTGRMSVPFRPEIAGTGEIKLAKIDLAEMSRSLPLGGSLTMEGVADGVVTLKMPVVPPGGSRQTGAEVELRAPKLKLQNFPAEKIKADARYSAGVVRYKLAGDALGGQFEVEGQYPPPPTKKTVPAPPKKLDPKLQGDLPIGRIRLKGVQLSKVLVQAGMQNTLGLLDADIDAIFPLETDAIDRLVGTGTLRATRIRWGDSSVALLGEGTLRLTPAEVSIENFSVPVGDGLARVTATFDRKNIDRSRGTLTLSNFPSDTLFFPFPGVAKWIKCRVNGTLATTLGREWRGSGVLVASQGSVYKIPIQEIRFPLDWVATPGAQRASVHIRELVGSVARGRVTGRAEVDFLPDSDPRLSGELKFGNVNVSTVFQSTRGIIGSTPVNGTFAFSSERLRTTDDIKATLQARTGESTPFGLPVLSQATPLLGLGPNANPPITSGELKSTLANGFWRIESLSLTGPSLDVFAEGTITTGGRLNLNVAGTPGRLELSTSLLNRLSTLASQVVSQPLNPAGAQQILGIIGNFVVYLDVTGSVDAPKFRVQTVRTISDGALRFLLLRYVPH